MPKTSEETEELPMGKDNDDECRKDCKDKDKCEREWWGGCKKDEDGIDIPKKDVYLPGWIFNWDD